ncbi:DUF885 domain-containing protein [Ramlibacter sp. XY19]|uniref:DUF885 domain-containing protein n=1 Tax=Ramlibacter paludis TaxID=2908000 RepID=UPI0023DAD8F2|nr:DUF885 domain-containing protein [Ramlibacter paludis]MCG2593109.1 DUF885 domain-containing protein [Ramlibacter paludis]
MNQMNPSTLSRRAFNAALVSSLAAPAAWAQAAATPVQQIADDYYRGIFALFPLEATENAGDPAYEAAFEIEIAPAHRARQRAFYERTLARLQAMDGASFSRDDRITRDLLAWDARDRLALMAVPHHLMPVTHAGGLPVRLAQWAGGEGSQPMKTTLHYEHFLQRLRGVPGWIDQAIANMQEGMAAGIVLPRALVERTFPQLDGLLPADPLQSPYLAGVRNFPATVPEADRPRLREAYTTLVREQLAPAVGRLRTFMRERYLPAARTTAGFGALPGGAGWYELLVRSFTTTDMTPEEIHALGLREVARIRGEMEKVKERFGFRGDLQAFFQSLDTRKELTPFRTDDEVMAAYRAINERVQAGLPRLFARAPKARLEIRPVDPLQRDTASSYYVPPSIDGSRPGVFFAAFTDAKTARTTQMAALFLHEGQPGHHYQIALQQESATSSFRRGAWWDAHGEGWALYAEGLGGELGLYDDANAWLGRLQMEMLRALRLVVDTGLHAKGWTREQAIAYSRENDGSSEDDARRAIERYMAWPGQATAYKVGELRILALRDKARAKLGERFDIRAFHAQVLGDGCMPLRMLETKVDEWLAAA